MDIDQASLDNMMDEAFAKGKVEGVKETQEEFVYLATQVKKLREILEVEGDQSLVEAAEHLAGEKRAYQEAWTSQMLRVQHLEKELKATKQYADEAYAVLEPAQKKIHEQNLKINELRQALLNHVKETA